jgi:predicted O-methyltransferase YrrM
MDVEQPNWQKIIEMGKGPNRPQMLTINDCELLFQSAITLKAHYIVEIGAAWGTSSIVLGLAAQRTSGHVFSLEMRPRQEWFDNIKKMGLDKIVTLIAGCSPAVHLDLPRPIDFLFIDGDHQTRSVLRDYYYWSHFVRVGGFIAFHDIYGSPSSKVNRAIEMILSDGSECLQERERCPVNRICGTVIFNKKHK